MTTFRIQRDGKADWSDVDGACIYNWDDPSGLAPGIIVKEIREALRKCYHHHKVHG